MGKALEYKRALNYKVYEYFNQNRDNIIIFEKLYDLIHTMEEENWFGVNDSVNNNPYEPTEVGVIFNDLKQSINNDLDNPLSELVSADYITNAYTRPLMKFCTKLTDKRCSAIAGITNDIEFYLKYAQSRKDKLDDDIGDWVYSHGCEEYMANSRFVCLDCGFRPLYYYSEECPFERGNPEFHKAITTEGQQRLAFESIYLGCRLLKIIHTAKIKKNTDSFVFREYVKEEFIKYLESLYDDKNFFSYIWKWLDGWYHNEEYNDIYTLIDFYTEQHDIYYNENENKYITRVVVDNLFGYLSYSLDFDVNKTSKSDLSIIIGPNGLGKTTVLKILEAILLHPNVQNTVERGPQSYTKNELIREREKLEYVCSVPFTSFVVEFSNGDKITLKKEIAGKASNDDEGMVEGILELEVMPWDAGFNTPFLPYKFNYKYQNGKYIFGEGKDFKGELIRVDETKVFEECNKKIAMMCPNINSENRFSFIHTNRIDDSEWRNAVSFYCSEYSFNKNKSMFEFVKDVEKKIMPAFVTEFEMHFIHQKTDRRFLRSVEMFKKTFNEFYDKEEDITYKELEVSSDGHLSVKINGKYDCDIDQLSSGEQNILAILYNLIFKSTKNAILFIDEPEISLHIAWQQRLTAVIKKIIKQKEGMQVIIASHSPFITSGDPDLYVIADISQPGE